MKFFENDVIFNSGDKAEEVFFIMKGRAMHCIDVNRSVDAVDPNLVHVITYVRGSYFGDIEIVTKIPRMCIAIAEEHMQVLYLKKSALKSHLKSNPEIGREFVALAKKRKVI